MATLKQKEAIRKITEKPSQPIGHILREVGYSEHVAKRPSDVTESKGFKELAARLLPDELLVKVTLDGLGAVKSDKELGVTADHFARHKYLETAMKARNLLKDDTAIEKPVTVVNQQVNIILQESKNKIKQLIEGELHAE